MLTKNQVTIQVIPSRYNLFWWEVVEVHRGKVVFSLGQFRSEEQAIDYVTENYK